MGIIKTARFGGQRGLAGKLKMRHAFQSGQQGVEWTTEDIKIPASMIKEHCGVDHVLPNNMTFSYSVHEHWLLHPFPWATGSGCGKFHTGGHWDPTAACSK